MSGAESPLGLDQAMGLALAEAQAAAQEGEVPVGAVLLDGQGLLLAQAHNRSIGAQDPTAHAEIQVLRQASARIGNYRLTGTTLVVTLEPCLMCLGAMVHARVARLVFGAADPRTGAVVSRLEGTELPWLNHRIAVQGGVMAEECGGLLRDFFAARRRAGVIETPDPDFQSGFVSGRG